MPQYDHWNLQPHSGGFGHDPLMGTMLLLLPVALGGLVPLWLIALARYREFQARRVRVVAEPSAVELLRRRYVLGEIDMLTFEEMLDELLATERSSLRLALLEAETIPVRYRLREEPAGA